MDPGAIAQGLITYANLPLYNKARVNFPPPHDYIPPKESVAVQVLENVLNKVVFIDDKYSSVFVNSQIPPHDNSNLACDLAINYMADDQEIRILCFIEAKRTINNTSYLTTAVEMEALDYCKEFFHSNRNNKTKFVYAGTLVGTHLRLWKVRRGEIEEETKLHALWGSDDFGSNEDYKDLGDDHDGQDIKKTFQDMVEIPPTPWINERPGAIRPTSQSGAYQLPIPNRARAIMPRTTPNLPPANQVPEGFERVVKFLSITQHSYSYTVASGRMGVGASSEWIVAKPFYVNSVKRLYADKNTEDLPVQL